MRVARSAARSSSSSSQAMSCFQGRWGELRLEGVGAQVPYEVGAGPDPADPEAAPHRLAQGAGLDHAGAGQRGFGAGRGAQVEVAHRLVGDHREEEARGPRRSCARRWGSGSRGRGRQSDAPRVDGRRQVGEIPAVAGRHRQRRQTGPAAPADAPGGGAARRGRGGRDGPRAVRRAVGAGLLRFRRARLSGLRDGRCDACLGRRGPADGGVRPERLRGRRVLGRGPGAGDGGLAAGGFGLGGEHSGAMVSGATVCRSGPAGLSHLGAVPLKAAVPSAASARARQVKGSARAVERLHHVDGTETLRACPRSSSNSRLS